MRISIIVFASIMLLSSCGDSKKAAITTADSTTVSNSLEGTWELDYISGPRIAFTGLYPEKKPTMTFNLADKKVNGNTSCNNYSGPVTIDGNKIGFGDFISTRMACPGEGEQIFLTTLKKINTYSISDGKTLTFIMGDIAMMRFQRR